MLVYAWMALGSAFIFGLCWWWESGRTDDAKKDADFWRQMHEKSEECYEAALRVRHRLTIQSDARAAQAAMWAARVVRFERALSAIAMSRDGDKDPRAVAHDALKEEWEREEPQEDPCACNLRHDGPCPDARAR